MDTIRQSVEAAVSRGDPVLLVIDEHNGQGRLRVAGFVIRILDGTPRGSVLVMHDALPAPAKPPTGGFRTIAFAAVQEVLTLVTMKGSRVVGHPAPAAPAAVKAPETPQPPPAAAPAPAPQRPAGPKPLIRKGQ